MCVCVIDFIFTPLSLSSLSLFPSLSTSLVPCFFLRSSVLTPRTLDWQQANPDSTIPLEERQYHCHIGNIIQNNQTTITKVSGHYDQQKKRYGLFTIQCQSSHSISLVHQIRQKHFRVCRLHLWFNTSTRTILSQKIILHKTITRKKS